jgi:hypothetical protein
LTPGSVEWNAMGHCRTRFAVKPRKGDAILFYHQDSAGNMDSTALHGACPVLRGEKWGANLWIWNGPVYQPGGLPKVDGTEEGPNTITFENRGKLPTQIVALNNFQVPVPIANIQPGESFTKKTNPGTRFESYTLYKDGRLSKVETGVKLTYRICFNTLYGAYARCFVAVHFTSCSLSMQVYRASTNAKVRTEHFKVPKATVKHKSRIEL